ncbi:acyl-[acyl-carrier-protein] thioesterase [Liquorilactobacillus sicerae]|uniref:acyl-[acyl-carrier-protein] thioesterase n=1 Tax=Liquorilactobacillus sicerae TaxID=1416943 RepID=UPI0024810D88|nr:acyl-ACP thioesterase domain-containing protein [Liquorilactobacillus sicerae]
MTAGIFALDHQIVFYETDQTRQLTAGMLVNLFMLASQEQSNHLNLTAQKVQSMNLGWVVTQHLVTIDRLPKLGEKVVIKTQAQSYNRFFCHRYFWLENQSGELLAKMHSVFVLINQKERKLTKVLPELVAPYGSVYTNKVEHLPEPKKANIEPTYPAKTYRVRFMDLDGNHHVNNVHYFDWLIDALPREFLLTHRLKAVNIRYKREVYYGQLVTSQVSVTNLGQQLISYHQILTQDLENCRAECRWEKIATLTK